MKCIHRFRKRGKFYAWNPPDDRIHFLWAGKWHRSELDCYWCWSRKEFLGLVIGKPGLWEIEWWRAPGRNFPTLRRVGLWLCRYPNKKVKE